MSRSVVSVDFLTSTPGVIDTAQAVVFGNYLLTVRHVVESSLDALPTTCLVNHQPMEIRLVAAGSHDPPPIGLDLQKWAHDWICFALPAGLDPVPPKVLVSTDPNLHGERLLAVRRDRWSGSLESLELVVHIPNSVTIPDGLVCVYNPHFELMLGWRVPGRKANASWLRDRRNTGCGPTG